MSNTILASALIAAAAATEIVFKVGDGVRTAADYVADNADLPHAFWWSNGYSRCSGTMIAPNVGLTAAHCVRRG